MFEHPLSDRALYWIGYIRADGYIHTNKETGRKILVFTQKDPYPVNELAAILGNKVYRREDVTNYGPSVKNKVATGGPIVRALDDLGVKTALLPEIYQSKHFWRGLLDGDGSVGYKRRAGSPDYPFLSYIGSTVDMTELSTWLGQIMQCRGPTVHACKSPGMSLVTLGGNKAKFTATYLYRGEYSALPYKRESAEAVMAWSGRKGKLWIAPT
jgi:hypothetical protein